MERMPLSTSLLWIALFFVIGFVIWYIEKRLRWLRFRSSVRGFIYGFIICASVGDSYSAVWYGEKNLNLVESKIRLPKMSSVPMCYSANYADFALKCIVEYAKKENLTSLLELCQQHKEDVSTPSGSDYLP